MRPGIRLLTLVGPGGVGKSRVALEVARRVTERFGGGAVHVDLDGVADAGLLASEAAAALGTVAVTAEELREQLARTNRAAPALLVSTASSASSTTPARSPGCSRASRASRCWRRAAPPSGCAASTSTWCIRSRRRTTRRCSSNARAPHVRGGLLREDERAVVDAICARLDGLPLAIELAADRVRVLSLPALLTRLERRLDVLTEGRRDRPERQRSLRATLEWSWDVLDERERRLLCLLTVFEGGAPLDAAVAVARRRPRSRA